jgi:hypothetical protein
MRGYQAWPKLDRREVDSGTARGALAIEMVKANNGLHDLIET